MKTFDRKLNNEERDLLLELYIDGLDEANELKISKVLQFALRDELLDKLIDQVNSYYATELGFDEATATVVRLAHEHLPSAFEEIEFEEKRLTFGDVASQLLLKNRVPVNEKEVNEKILTSTVQLPEYLILSEIKRLAHELKVMATDRFWALFRKEAIFLTMRQSQQQAALATRVKRRKRENGETDESRKTNQNG